MTYPTPYLTVYRQASAETGVPLPLLFGITRTESYFDPRAKSIADARGLMQLLVKTATLEGLGQGEDLFEPRTNITLGARHLARLLKQFGGTAPYSIAAYNGGADAVNRWRTRFPKLELDAWIEMIGYSETRNYVRRVSVAMGNYEALLKQ